jgi:DNA-binding XRE family transcriptional regulator
MARGKRNDVQRLREEQLMSKAELARRAGVSVLTIDRVERGPECRVDTKRKIILALGFSVEDRRKVFPDGTLRRSAVMAKGKLAIGLDIGSTSVKMIQLKETRRRGEVIYSLQNFGMKPLPPEAIVDNALMNSTAIVQAIQELIGELRIKQKETAISVSGHSVIIKKIQMPQMSSAELDESIQWEAEQYIPFDVKDVNIDTQILSTEGPPPPARWTCSWSRRRRT